VLTPEYAGGISIDLLEQIIEGWRWGNALVAMPSLVSIPPVEDPLLSLHIIPELGDDGLCELPRTVESGATLEKDYAVAFKSESHFEFCANLRRDSGIAVLLEQFGYSSNLKRRYRQPTPSHSLSVLVVSSVYPLFL